MKHTKFISALLLSIALFCASGISARAADDYAINLFDMHITVRDDNSYAVTESYDITFTGKQHGFEAKIPLKFHKDAAEIRALMVEGTTFTSYEEDGNLVVRMGSASEYVSGKKHWELSYVYDIGKDSMNDIDEFYYNLIAEYNVEIAKMTFTIEMPHRFDESSLNFTGGAFDSTDKADVTYTIDGNTITGSVNGSVPKGTQMTVALVLPEGYYTTAKKLPFVWKGGGVDLPILLMIPICALSFVFLKMFKGRTLFPTVEFYPPQNTTPADVGYIIDGVAEPMDILSLLFYWADRGYLDITEIYMKQGFGQKKGYVFRKLREMGQEAKPYERQMFGQMFRFGHDNMVSTFDLERSTFYSTLDTAAKSVRSAFESKNTRIFEKNTGLKSMLVRLPGVICLAIALYPMIYEQNHEGFPSDWALAFVGAAAFALMLSLPVAAIMGKVQSNTGKKSTIFLSALPMLIILGVLLVLGYNLGYFTRFLAGFVTMYVPLFLAYQCRPRTEYGSRYQEMLLGFKQFLESTELDRINLLINENPGYFFNILPYAMALHITDKWAKNFEHLAVAPPNWYFSQDQGNFRASAFVGGLSATMSVVASDINSSRPRTSDGGGSRGSGGSRSGGSAGGGAGGGSRGSW
ncbi:hypothetical protein FACS1894219_04250 [Clostridia bacterium]|nr:hypothetical protein FACS1894219_04250 [Clostridia bacterium]